MTNPGYLVPPTSVTYYATDRGAFHFDGFWRTDLSLSWNYKIYKKTQIFFRAVAGNVFNNQALQGFNTSVTTSGMASFNPFTTTPVEGVNWKKDSLSGRRPARAVTRRHATSVSRWGSASRGSASRSVLARVPAASRHPGLSR